MPQKTKKEKIIAEYRKRLKLLKQQGYTEKKSEIKSPLTSDSLQTVNIKKLTKETVDNNSLFYFKNDLKKSLILVFFIIVLEISLYFANILK